MYKILRNFLFLFDAELIHEFSVKFIKVFFNIPLSKTIIRKLFVVNHYSLEKKLFGLTFKNPVGLAAGFDKNAVAIKPIFYLGFGFLEVGAVTPQSQPGNPKPRAFRIIEEKAIVNHYGFNNDGMVRVNNRLKKFAKRSIIGVNIGANKKSTKDKRIEDYKVCFEKIYQYADYVTVNISSPNTPELRNFHDPD